MVCCFCKFSIISTRNIAMRHFVTYPQERETLTYMDNLINGRCLKVLGLNAFFCVASSSASRLSRGIWLSLSPSGDGQVGQKLALCSIGQHHRGSRNEIRNVCSVDRADPHFVGSTKCRASRVRPAEHGACCTRECRSSSRPHPERRRAEAPRSRSQSART